ncbi:hypothetical protein LTR28_001311, partial [Elasticomyces elasticus]
MSASSASRTTTPLNRPIALPVRQLKRIRTITRHNIRSRIRELDLCSRARSQTAIADVRDKERRAPS